MMILSYLDENDFHKKESAVRMYNMLAYRELIFKYYLELRKGNFFGKKVNKDNNSKTVNYELELTTDIHFKEIYGAITLHYTVYEEKNLVLLTNITPEEILLSGYKRILPTYKGIPYATNKDLFKIKLVIGGNSGRDIKK